MFHREECLFLCFRLDAGANQHELCRHIQPPNDIVCNFSNRLQSAVIIARDHRKADANITQEESNHAPTDQFCIHSREITFAWHQNTDDHRGNDKHAVNHDNRHRKAQRAGSNQGNACKNGYSQERIDFRNALVVFGFAGMPVNQDALEHHEEGDTENGAKGSCIGDGCLEQAEAVVRQQREHERRTQQLAVSARESTRGRHKGKHREHGRHDRLGVELQGARIREALAYGAAGIKVKPILACGNEEEQGEDRESDFLSSCL